MKSCLVVDDSRVVRKVAIRILTELGFECFEAEDGKVALEHCQSHGMPDCVLLDWNMPIMNGLEYLLELRKLPQGDGPVVIFCTTENDMDHIQKAIGAGANEYIMKPFDIDIVRSKMIQCGLVSD